MAGKAGSGSGLPIILDKCPISPVVPNMGTCYGLIMRVIAKRTLRAFWQRHPDAEHALKAWHSEVRRAEWKDPHAVKDMYRNASVIGRSRVVFNICGNKYRLVVQINYFYGVAYVRFVGTHAEYDIIDAETV